MLATKLQTLMEILRGLFQFIRSFRFLFYVASIDVGDHFPTEIAHAANAVGSQDGKQLIAFSSLRLALSQLLKCLRNRSDVSTALRYSRIK